MEPLSLTATGLEVHEQHTTSSRAHRLPRRLAQRQRPVRQTQRVLRERRRNDDRDDPHEHRHERSTISTQHHSEQHTNDDHHHHHSEQPFSPRPGEREPARRHEHDEQHHLDKSPQRLGDDTDHRGHHHSNHQQHRSDRREPSQPPGPLRGRAHHRHAISNCTPPGTTPGSTCAIATVAPVPVRPVASLAVCSGNVEQGGWTWA